MNCENCGTKLFERTGKGRNPTRFCSSKCKDAVYSRESSAARADRRAARPPCSECGGRIPDSANNRAVTCSAKCGNDRQNRIKQERKVAAWRATNPSCARCGVALPDGRHRRSKYCSIQCKRLDHARRWRERSPGYMRQYLYGLTPDQFATMLADQGGRCAICRADTPGGKGGWHVDHNHDTNAVRGLLCHDCNLGVGQFGDDPDRLIAAAAYLRVTV